MRDYRMNQNFNMVRNVSLSDSFIEEVYTFTSQLQYELNLFYIHKKQPC